MNRLSITLLAAGVLVAATYALAQNAEVKQAASNPLAGKVVIFESGTAFRWAGPYEDVKTKTLAGNQYYVCRRSRDDEPIYDFWVDADEVKILRVFDTKEDAIEFQDNRK